MASPVTKRTLKNGMQVILGGFLGVTAAEQIGLATSVMFRDVKAGLPVEADHVIGDLVARADAAKIPVPKLRIAYTHLKAYEKQRAA